LNVFLKAFSDLALFLIPIMEIEPVAKRRALAGRKHPITFRLIRVLLKIVYSKRIGPKQTVVANVPPSWMSGILGMIEDSDANGFAIDRTVVIAPFGSFAPRLQ
jgi:hypothetical protein